MTYEEKLDNLVINVATMRTDITYIKNSINKIHPLDNRLSVVENDQKLIKKILYGMIGIICTCVIVSIVGLVVIWKISVWINF